MKLTGIISAAAALALPGIATAADLGRHLWQSRPILVFALPDDPRLETQLERFRKADAALSDRQNVVIVDTEPGSALRSLYRPGSFTVILIGKDGGEKFRRDALVDPEDLNALIDTMPMRRREMQQDR